MLNPQVNLTMINNISLNNKDIIEFGISSRNNYGNKSDFESDFIDEIIKNIQKINEERILPHYFLKLSVTPRLKYWNLSQSKKEVKNT